MSSKEVAEGRVESRIGYQMKRAQHALRVEMDRAVREVGMTTAQYAALSTLEAAPGLSGAELARRSFVTPQTMNAILANLEAAGLVVRRPNPEHGRVLQAYLTEMGEESVAKAHGLVEAVERRMLDRLSHEDRRWLLETLRGCADALEGGVGSTAASA
jgi:DNA-binding MarR family transcriptional regulator